MKLIAENEQENRILHGLTGLLQDLGVDVIGHTTHDAAAVTFWSCEDIPQDIPNKDAFLEAIEDDLYSSMIAAGYETIERCAARFYDSRIMQAHRESNS